MFGSSNSQLDSRLRKIEEYLEKKDKKFKESLTLNQKLLALAELGVIDNLLQQNNENKSKLAELLFRLLDVSEQNLREELSHYQIKGGSNLYTVTNLCVIRDLFEKTKFSEATKSVKNELDRLSSKKM